MFRIGIAIGIGLIWDFIWIPLLPLYIILGLFFPVFKKYISTRTWRFLDIQHDEYKKIALFYCSSAGEYEQACPLVEKSEERGFEPIFVFFSINGFIHAQSQKEKRKMFIAPYDSFLLWVLFLWRINPKVIYIIKHEFWPCCIASGKLFGKVNALLVPKKSTKGMKLLFQKMIFWFVDYTHTLNYPGIGKNEYFLDTRPSRIESKINSNPFLIAKYGLWKQNIIQLDEKLLIVGNAYLSDILQLMSLIQSTGFPLWLKIFIVPHSKTEEIKIRKIIDNKSTQNFTIKPTTFFSDVSSMSLICVYGELLWIYSMADFIWIGGGFTNGVHSIWEAAYFNKPLTSGPNLNQEPDAILFQQMGCLYDIETFWNGIAQNSSSFLLPSLVWDDYKEKTQHLISSIM